ncbi:MAG: hypothetical protein IPK79_04865 [Vampirovibrionales bacterium]|nr:hypothetical protein [Vampirovibrionales bacterium]
MNNRVLKSGALAVSLLAMIATTTGAAIAENSDPPHSGKITGRSVAAGVLSFLIWPGIGQAVNSDRGRKVGTHAVAGLFPPFRFWSGYDALVNRKGGYWEGRL